jgi:hypothetical protein
LLVSKWRKKSKWRLSDWPPVLHLRRNECCRNGLPEKGLRRPSQQTIQMKLAGGGVPLRAVKTCALDLRSPLQALA